MEEQTEIIITSETEGKRLDAVLAEKTDGLSRSFLQKLFEEGKVFRNGKLCSKKEKGVEGDGAVGHRDVPDTHRNRADHLRPDRFSGLRLLEPAEPAPRLRGLRRERREPARDGGEDHVP